MSSSDQRVGATGAEMVEDLDGLAAALDPTFVGLGQAPAGTRVRRISIEWMRSPLRTQPDGHAAHRRARTALYTGFSPADRAHFVLRIEDTDRERSTPENLQQIIDGLSWFGIDWDEGPISQWERRERHTEAVDQLLASGDAYEDEGAVRFRVPQEGEITFRDAILGDITNPYSAIKDFVIRRSDGSPLYNLAVAVDDLDMGITHVVRGQDHVSNTPRQLMLLRALGQEPPVYAHIPLLHGTDGRQLSKRHGAASVGELQQSGYLPEAVRNYVALLGWGYDETTTFMTTDELIERFALEGVSKNRRMFDEQKLRWMNGHYRASCHPGGQGPPGGPDRPRDPLRRWPSAREDATLSEFWPLPSSRERRTSTRGWDKGMATARPSA